MSEKIIRPERRRLERRQDRLSALSEAVSDSVWSERRIHCWNLSPECTETRRKRCAAHFVQRNCWDLWAAEYFPPGRKPCCHDDRDCSECAVAAAKFGGPISVFVEVPSRAEDAQGPSGANGRAGYCSHLFSMKDPQGGRGDGETRPIFKCQRRRGITIHGTYVTEVCGTVDYRQCPFYESE